VSNCVSTRSPRSSIDPIIVKFRQIQELPVAVCVQNRVTSGIGIVVVIIEAKVHT
jgi:hypothetical protein